MKIHRCQEHGYPTWPGEICPKCQIAILREALDSIANCNYKNATDFQEWAKDALQRLGVRSEM